MAANDIVIGNPLSDNFGNVGTFSRADGNAIRIRPEVDEMIARVEPAEAPLDTLLRLAGRIEGGGNNPEYNVQEESPITHKTTMTGAETAADTTLQFDDSSFLVPTMVGKNLRTGEQFWLNNTAVNTVATGTVTNVVRSFGTTAAAAMVAGDEVVFLNTALEEGQNKIQTRMRATGSHLNFAALIEHGISLSDTEALLPKFGPPEASRLMTQNMLEFRKMRNRSLLLSEPNRDSTSGNQIVYTTGGLRFWAEQFNNASIGPGISYDVIADVLAQVIRHGGSNQGRMLWALTSQRIWNLISGLPEIRDIARTVPEDDTVGFEITKIKFPGGMLNLAVDHNMEDFDEMLVFDLNNLSIKQTEPLSIRTNVETPGSHRQENQIFVREGLMVRLPLSTARLYNMRYVA